MQLNLDTTINALYKNGLISVRTINCLRYAGMNTMEDVLNYAEDPEELLKLKNFGRKSYTEIEPLIRNVRQEHGAPSPQTANEMFEMVGETIGQMLREAYDSLFGEETEMTRYFKSVFPSVVELHSLLVTDDETLTKVREGFSMQENVEYRRVIVTYLDNAINRMVDGKRADNDTYATYKERHAELARKVEVFSYPEKVEYFMSAGAREFFKTHYDKMREKLSVRARNFLDHFAPNFQDLVPYFEAPLTDYKNLCPGQNMKHTLTEIFNFNQELKTEFDRYWQMSSDEVLLAMLKHSYPFLSSLERKFVCEHAKVYGVHPLFYLLYNYMRLSDVKNNKVFSLLYGIFDGQERTLNELAEAMSLTRERIRQIVSKKLEVHDNDLIKNDGWKSYDDLLTLPFITEETNEYQHLKEREHLRFDFRVFARLMQLLGDRDFEINVKSNNRSIGLLRFAAQYETEIVGNVAVSINRRKMPCIKVKDCIESLNQLVSSRYTNDTRIDVATSLGTMSNEEKADATKLMAYLAKEGLGLEVDEDNRVLVQKNHIDVAEDLYTILARKGEPMSVDELFVAFKEMYPDHKYTESAQIRSWLFRHPNIKPIGNTSRYGLDSWENVFFGTIRDLLAKLLEESDEPMHIEQLFEAVVEHYPNTKPQSLEWSMGDDTLGRFVHFNDGFYGLKSKSYDAKWIEYDATARQRQSFEERLADFCAFVESYNRYPVSGNGEGEASLYRWLYNVQNEVYEIKEEYKVMLTETLARYEQDFIPRNGTENEFRNNCQRYKDYINSHYALPSVSAEPELYSWMVRSKANYNSFVDHRRKYLTDLFNYILSLGFSI